MQNGDLNTQSTEDVATPTEESTNPVSAELCETVAVTESASRVSAEPPTDMAESTPQLSGRARLRSRIEFTWQRLREQRREASAVVVLIVIAMVWFDSGSSGTGSTNSQDPFDSYDTVLSDFEPVEDDQAMRESSDPFETSSQNSSGGDLFIPQTEGSAQTDAFLPRNVSADGSRPTTTARYPDTASAFNTSTTQTSAGNGSGQQQPRKVKFAGRIQPAN